MDPNGSNTDMKSFSLTPGAVWPSQSQNRNGMEAGTDEPTDSSSNFPGGVTPLRDQDRFLPIANVSKIMKKAIANKNGKIAKETKERMQECLSEFVSFITSEAAEKCQNEKRKTINGDDLIYAMRTLGFDNYVDPLTVFLNKYRETNKLDIPTTAGQESLSDTLYPGASDGLEDGSNFGIQQQHMYSPAMGGSGTVVSAPGTSGTGLSYLPLYTNGAGGPVTLVVTTGPSNMSGTAPGVQPVQQVVTLQSAMHSKENSS